MNASELMQLFGLSEAYCIRLSQTLLHFLWQGCVIGLVAWAAAAVTAFNRNPSAPQPGPAGGGSVPPVQPRW